MLKTLERPTSKGNGNGRKSETKMEIIVVTPDIAQAWLDKNTHNRKPSARHVDKLARDMIAGNFVYTGDAIRFDIKGNLIDGQHRLMACVKAEKGFETLVIYDLPPATQDKLDAGKNRGAGDVISLSGFHYANQLAAACRLMIHEREGMQSIGTLPLSTSDVTAMLKQHSTLPSAMNEVASKRYPRGISNSNLAVVYYVGRDMLGVAKVADAFIEVMTTGIPFSEGCAAHAYRERVVKSHIGGSMAMTATSKWRMMKHAWNLFSNGQSVKNIRAPETVTFDGVDPSDW